MSVMTTAEFTRVSARTPTGARQFVTPNALMKPLSETLGSVESSSHAPAHIPGMTASQSVQLTTLVNCVIQRHGGIKGLIEKFKDRGLHSLIQSWLLPGANRPVTAEQIQEAVGPGLVCELAASAGLSPQTLATRLAVFLPIAIDSQTSQEHTHAEPE